MDIKEMEENGTIDYYLELKKYINSFINKNYPLSQDDLRSILEERPTQNVIKRQDIQRKLNDAMEDALKAITEKNNQMLNGANEGEFTQYSVQDFEKDIFSIKQEMLERLWLEQQKIEKQPTEKQPQVEHYQDEQEYVQENNTGTQPNENEQNINEEVVAPQIDTVAEIDNEMER